MIANPYFMQQKEAYFQWGGEISGLETQRDVLMFLVEEHMALEILETIAEVGEFEAKPGTGIAFQIDVEDAVGISQQLNVLKEKVKAEV